MMMSYLLIGAHLLFICLDVAANTTTTTEQ